MKPLNAQHFAAELGRHLKKSEAAVPSPPGLRPRLAGEQPIKPPVTRSEPAQVKPAVL